MIILHFSTMINIASNIFNDIQRIDFHEFEKDFLFIVNGKMILMNLKKIFCSLSMVKYIKQIPLLQIF